MRSRFLSRPFAGSGGDVHAKSEAAFVFGTVERCRYVGRHMVETVSTAAKTAFRCKQRIQNAADTSSVLIGFVSAAPPGLFWNEIEATWKDEDPLDSCGLGMSLQLVQPNLASLTGRCHATDVKSEVHKTKCFVLILNVLTYNLNHFPLANYLAISRHFSGFVFCCVFWTRSVIICSDVTVSTKLLW